MGVTKKDNHDTYIAAAPEQLRAMLGQLRVRLARALPDAEEVIKYDMPGFQIGETIIVGYAAFSLVFPSLEEFSTVSCDPHSQRLWHCQ